MDQQLCCPHCAQTVAVPVSLAGKEVTCGHCAGVFLVPDIQTRSSAPQRPKQGGSKRPAPVHAGLNTNAKLALAAGALAVAVAVPTLIYAVIQSVSRPTAVAQSSAGAASKPAAGDGRTLPATESSAAAAAPVSAPAPVAREAVKPPVSGSAITPAAITPAPTTPVAPFSTPTADTPSSRGAPQAAPATESPSTQSRGAQPPAGQPPAGQASAAPSTTALIQQIEPSVLVVQVTLERGGGIGSGFPLDDQGTFVTNYHVIEGAKSAKIKIHDKTFDVKGYLAISPGKDLAILRADLGSTPVSPLKLAAAKPQKGETVLTFGAPLGFDSTVSNGIVSAVRTGNELRDIFKRMSGGRDAYVEDEHYDLDAVWVQITAPISGGNSGGPLVNLRGEVVGLNTWGVVGGQNLNFAISAEHIQKLLATSQSGVQPLAGLPEPRKVRLAAGTAERTLEYWNEAARINRGLSNRLRKIRQPAVPNNVRQLMALFPKLAGIYKKMADYFPDAARKLKALKIDDVDQELVVLVTNDAIFLEHLGDLVRRMSADVKQLNLKEVAIFDFETLSKKQYGKSDGMDLGTAYDAMRINLTSRYGLTFNSIFDARKATSSASGDDDDAHDDVAHDDGVKHTAGSSGDASSVAAGGEVDPKREKDAAKKLALAKQLKQAGKAAVARERFARIVKDYAGTEAAKEAEALLAE